MLQSLQPFEYPLLVGEDQIRLLELHPADLKRTELQFRFRIISLRETPPFTALRVIFPIPEDCAQEYVLCTLNGQATLRLKSAVYGALEVLRSSAHATLWVEELCVDQDSPKDKSYHAAIEQEIFRKATETLTVRRPEVQYQSLDPINSEIRLLRIHPANSVNSPLVVEVFTASLNDKPEYVALSYVWGSNDLNWGILSADGSMFSVMKNLFLALHELR